MLEATAVRYDLCTKFHCRVRLLKHLHKCPSCLEAYMLQVEPLESEVVAHLEAEAKADCRSARTQGRLSLACLLPAVRL